ncbi:hypothetical protein GCM10010236_72470 [Streptomyces eurythermus]|nr:hypothetical protein GCM10010236_72470 [Streptomyces eurythermus]
MGHTRNAEFDISVSGFGLFIDAFDWPAAGDSRRDFPGRATPAGSGRIRRLPSEPVGSRQSAPAGSRPRPPEARH